MFRKKILYMVITAAFMFMLAGAFGIGQEKVCAASGKKSVYVLVKCDRNNQKFTYYKNGLLKKATYYRDWTGGKATYIDTFTYNKDMMVKTMKEKCKSSFKPWVYTSYLYCDYDSEGNLIGYRNKSTEANSNYTVTYYHDDDGLITESVYKNSNGVTSRSDYKYDNSNILCQNGGIKYKYDKKLNLKIDCLKNVYKNGRLVKRKGTGYCKGLSIKYQYKKIQVDAKYYLRVIRQQWALLNDDNNFEFGFFYTPIILGWS